MVTRRVIPLLLVAAFTLPAFAQSADAVRPVPVMLDSRPEFAEVKIDGKFVGTAPLQFRLAPGEHKIEMSRLRHAAWTRELTVTRDNPTRVVALLEDAKRDELCK